MSDDIQPAKKRWSSRSELMKMPRDDLVDKILKQVKHIEYLIDEQQAAEAKMIQMRDSADKLRETADKLRETNDKQKATIQEGTQRESILVLRLTNKEQDVQDLITQVQEIKQWQNSGGSSQLQSRFLDPAVNVVVQRLKQELDERKTKIELAENDLLAVKFTPDSQTGKRLMAKCRLLHQENEELGRMISSGRVAKLEGDVALSKKLIQDMRICERDTESFLVELDDEQEAMQATIYAQQSELRKCREKLQALETENERLRSDTATGSRRATKDSPLDSRRPAESNEGRGSSGGNPRSSTGNSSSWSANRKRYADESPNDRYSASDRNSRGGGRGSHDREDQSGYSRGSSTRTSSRSNRDDRSTKGSRYSPDRKSYRRNRTPDSSSGKRRSPESSHRNRTPSPDRSRRSRERSSGGRNTGGSSGNSRSGGKTQSDRRPDSAPRTMDGKEGRDMDKDPGKETKMEVDGIKLDNRSSLDSRDAAVRNGSLRNDNRENKNNDPSLTAGSTVAGEKVDSSIKKESLDKMDDNSGSTRLTKLRDTDSRGSGKDPQDSNRTSLKQETIMADVAVNGI